VPVEASPVGFARLWLKESGIKPKDKKARRSCLEPINLVIESDIVEDDWTSAVIKRRFSCNSRKDVRVFRPFRLRMVDHPSACIWSPFVRRIVQAGIGQTMPLHTR